MTGSPPAVSTQENDGCPGEHSLRAWREKHPWATDEEIRGWMLCWLLRHADQDDRCPSMEEFDRLRVGRLEDEFEDLAMDVFGGPPVECFRVATRDLHLWILQTHHSRI